ncbi:hypothetical protein ABTZ59_12610 [Streptomyces sp. NPDC094034]|uniref:hypothetical protein n=1 Tax=Streptomyces sp. NPDC094034 TaxID=3155309 RepID=UPI003331BA56
MSEKKMPKSPSEKKRVFSPEQKTAVLKEWIKWHEGGGNQQGFVDDYNKRTGVRENPRKQITKWLISDWLAAARENPKKFPDLKSDLPEAPKKNHSNLSKEEKGSALNELVKWQESGRTWADFIDDYNKRTGVRGNPKKQITEPTLSKWVKAAAENPEKFPGLESGTQEALKKFRARHACGSRHSTNGKKPYDQAVAYPLPSDMADLYDIVSSQLESELAADTSSINPPPDYAYPSYYGQEYGQEYGQDSSYAAGGTYAMPQGMEPTFAAPTNPYATYAASAAPDPYGTSQSSGQGGWQQGVAVSTYPPVSPYAAEAGQYNAWVTNEHQTSGPSTGYQPHAPTAHNQGERKTRGQKR